jgi:glyoxylate carboligase
MSTLASAKDRLAAIRPKGRISPWWILIGLAAALFLLSVLQLVTGADDLASSGTIRATIIATVPIALAGLVALGARFDDRVTGNLATFAPKARIVHADIDPAEIGKNRTADVPIVGDVKLVVDELVTAYRAAVAAEGAGDTEAWQRACAQWKQRFPFRYDQQDGGPLKPQHVVERVSALTGGEAVATVHTASAEVGLTVSATIASTEASAFDPHQLFEASTSSPAPF